MSVLFLSFRARRRRAREAKGITDHNDGMSTDDEENQGEIAKFNMDRGRHSVVNSRFLAREAVALLKSQQIIYTGLFQYRSQDCCP